MNDEIEGAMVALLLSNKTSHIFSVQPLMEFCETAKRMVASRARYGSRDDGSTVGTSFNKLTPESHESGENKINPIMKISLEEFDADAVISFIEVLTSLHNHQKSSAISSPNNKSASQSRKRHANTDMDDILKEHLLALIYAGKMSEQHIVECLKISHYLQCHVVLHTLAAILEFSIDSNNCMAICSLADSLNLKSLFEASVNFVIERLDTLQGSAANEGGDENQSTCLSSGDDINGKDEFDEIWSSLPYELRSRVLTMRNVMRSSVIGRGSKVSGLFFSSASEFLAIFRETIRDQEERLADARKRSEELIRERREEWSDMCQRRGSWFDRSVQAEKEFVYGVDVVYSLDKIEKQSRRLNTLTSFYEDQKKIFKGGGFASEIIL
jgi:hypothetical protein